MDLSKFLDYVKSINLTKVQGETIELTDEADKTLYQLIEIKNFIEEADKKLKERFLEIAKKNPKLKSYEGNNVMVGYRMTRRKLITGNPDERFYEIEKKPNTKAIDAYREAIGKLPDGIEEKTFEYINFKGVK